MKSILIFLLLLGTSSLHAQTINDDLGAVSCNFKFYSGANELDISKQSLIQRSKAISDASSAENESYGYGYAYTEWHIELISNTSIGSRDWKYEETRSKRRKYHVQFMNSKGQTLLSSYVSQDKIKLWKGENFTVPIYTYSINLIDLPIILLDEITSINIIYVK